MVTVKASQTAAVTQSPYHHTPPLQRDMPEGCPAKKLAEGMCTLRVLQNGESGAFATWHFAQGDFVCEYASKVLPKEQSMADKHRYQEAGLGSYCLDATYQGNWYTFDATLTLKDPGQYINHASSHCNLRLMPAIMIGRGESQRLRIQCGDQLFFDYGSRDQEWMVCDARKCALTLKPICTFTMLSNTVCLSFFRT